MCLLWKKTHRFLNQPNISKEYKPVKWFLMSLKLPKNIINCITHHFLSSFKNWLFLDTCWASWVSRYYMRTLLSRYIHLDQTDGEERWAPRTVLPPWLPQTTPGPVTECDRYSRWMPKMRRRQLSTSWNTCYYYLHFTHTHSVKHVTKCYAINTVGREREKGYLFSLYFLKTMYLSHIQFKP